ncbi:MAG: serine/threonine protein kinase, partial [Planctomycetales bacterium]|nr:serine/threonine protein kinase [Planctomycetales bacterium]
MIDARYTLTTDASPDIDAAIARFDRDRKRGPVERLVDYAPPPDDPSYSAVITELARIDLERRFEETTTGSAAIYIDEFPDVFVDQYCRAQVAYEEYRLRRRFNEDVDPDAMGKAYGIDASQWMPLPLGEDATSGNVGGGLVSDRPSSQYRPRPLASDSVDYPSVGGTYAGYELVAELGRGAYSRVFLARQHELAQRFVVLKITPMEAEESDKLARLQHSHIIPIYSVHRQGNLSGICMPFLGATTLADVSAVSERWTSLNGPAQELVSTVRNRRQSTIELVSNAGVSAHDSSAPESSDKTRQCGLPDQPVNESVDSSVGLQRLSSLGYVDALLELVIGAVEGVAHAHRRGIIHRDLKPANVLITDEGSPVVLDFNLAESVEDADVRVVGGTLPYMSPQQLESLRSGGASKAEDDVFSIGVILYELLTGRLPFSSPPNNSSFDLDALIEERRQPPRQLRQLNVRVSSGLQSIVMRCLADNPSDRYRDAFELLEDLRGDRKNNPLRHALDRSAG